MIEVERRVRSIVEYLLQGYRAADICRNVAAKWGISQRQAERYLADAHTSIAKDNADTFKDAINFHQATRLNALRDLQTLWINTVKEDAPTLYKAKVLSTLNREMQIVRQDLAKLQGLYTEKVEHSGTVTMPSLVIQHRPSPTPDHSDGQAHGDEERQGASI